jgi:TonB family protein
MGRRLIIFFLALLATAANAALAQDTDTSHRERALVRRVAPVYPDLARQLKISGVVKLSATVAPTGAVKSIEAIGGNPVLIKAAQDAVRSWKYATAPDESRVLIELRFNAK